jgi:hypothetical protein
MTVIVAFSTIVGTLLVENWHWSVKAFWSSIGMLPLLAWTGNFFRAPVPVELELLFFFAGVFAGSALLVQSIRVESPRRVGCAFAGMFSAGASITAGIVAVSLYFLP